jgi:hypothetical protein
MRLPPEVEVILDRRAAERDQEVSLHPLVDFAEPENKVLTSIYKLGSFGGRSAACNTSFFLSLERNGASAFTWQDVRDLMHAL